jgi:hypothetical protein|tara:strand:- start:496 stop:909 length:414 start_codon:yes stop_codon:yes gene_type:complete
MTSDNIKVAILGSDTYENIKKIKNHIYLWKEDFGEKLVVISGGGKYGAEKYVKEICLEFDINYQEIPPFHYKWNQYCLLGEHKYNKNYNIKHYFVQNKLIVDSVDLVVFFESGDKNTKLKDLKRYTEKQKKSLFIKS